MKPLPMEDMKRILKSRAALVDDYLSSCLKHFPGVPDRLKSAMLYSIEGGGKRLRPVLCLTCGLLCGLAIDKSLPFAAAIEMIHTYSLIHDDLPAMDNDDLRRGRPSNHKQFDEATAILAGDGLLTDAFAIALKTPVQAANLLEALGFLARAAGSSGMVGGQMLDMEYTGKRDIDLSQVRQMQKLKTGAMIHASCICGAALANAPENLMSALSSYGGSFGAAFQIADDILDLTGTTEELGKPAGSDEASGKNTYPCLVGLEESRNLARELADKAISSLPNMPESAFLAALAEYAVARKN